MLLNPGKAPRIKTSKANQPERFKEILLNNVDGHDFRPIIRKNENGPNIMPVS
jgi:hypothetical protein